MPHCYFRSVVFHYIACNFRFVKATRTARPSRLQRQRQHQLANFLQPVSPCVLTVRHPRPLLVVMAADIRANKRAIERTNRTGTAQTRVPLPIQASLLSLSLPANDRLPFAWASILFVRTFRLEMTNSLYVGSRVGSPGTRAPGRFA